MWKNGGMNLNLSMGLVNLPLLVWVAGLLMYIFMDEKKYGKAVQIGRTMFFIGLFIWLMHQR